MSVWDAGKSESEVRNRLAQDDEWRQRCSMALNAVRKGDETETDETAAAAMSSQHPSQLPHVPSEARTTRDSTQRHRFRRLFFDQAGSGWGKITVLLGSPQSVIDPVLGVRPSANRRYSLVSRGRPRLTPPGWRWRGTTWRSESTFLARRGALARRESSLASPRRKPRRSTSSRNEISRTYWMTGQ